MVQENQTVKQQNNRADLHITSFKAGRNSKVWLKFNTIAQVKWKQQEDA